jgi:hypothetical protein
LVATVVNEVNVDVGMTSNCSGDVGERRKVARRWDGTAKRDDGSEAEVDELDESLEDDETDGGVTTARKKRRVSFGSLSREKTLVSSFLRKPEEDEACGSGDRKEQRARTE